MPFDPHIIRPDDAPLDAHGELQLPDDLAELAAQLGDDASFLAQTYPAKLPSRFSRGAEADDIEVAAAFSEKPAEKTASSAPVWHRSSARIASAVAAASLLIAVSAVWWGTSAGDRPNELTIAEAGKPASPERIESPAAPSAPSHVIAAHEPDELDADDPLDRATSPIPTAPRAGPPSLAPSPAMFLHEYSGPELEGLYDLLEDSENGQVSI
jgi:hypothetical protein